jgi:hypothetical protein
MNEKVQRAKNNQDKEHNDVTKLFALLPTYLLGIIVTVGSYLGQCVGISIPPLGVRLFYFNYQLFIVFRRLKPIILVTLY